MKLALLGDIALFGSFSGIKNQNLMNNLKEIADYLSSFDYVVGNLETPFSATKRTYGAKSAYIFAEPEDICILQFLHINAVTLANNHMFDFGIEGYELTKQLLKQEGIEWFGSEGKELRIGKDDNIVTFAGFCCYTSNPLNCVKYGDYGINAYNLSKAKDFIETNRKKGYLPILVVHAGMEHVNYPSLDHIRAARILSNAGNYVYYGHHPHVVQGLEEYKGSLIAHSLGNFCFDDIWTDVSSDKPLVELTDNNRIGMILELVIENSKLLSWKEQLIHIKNDGHIRLINKDDDIKDYNIALRNCEDNENSYIIRRRTIIENRMAERKSERNFLWYLKRFRPRYAQILLNARRNSILFKRNVLKYLTN